MRELVKYWKIIFEKVKIFWEYFNNNNKFDKYTSFKMLEKFWKEFREMLENWDYIYKTLEKHEKFLENFKWIFIDSFCFYKEAWETISPLPNADLRLTAVIGQTPSGAQNSNLGGLPSPLAHAGYGPVK